MLIEAKKVSKDGGNVQKAEKLSAIRKQFKKCRLILQVNIHSESGDKYAFVTNLQRRKQSKSEMQVLFRNITKSNALVNQEKIAAVKKEIDRLSKGDSKASEYFDFILAKAQPSA